MIQYRTFKYVSVIICALSICSAVWIYSKLVNTQETITKPLSHYDYIVVGAGTAGCVVASRLSEDEDKSVLLIEAGDYFNFFSSVPLLALMVQGTKNDWAFKTEPQKHASFGYYKQSQAMPRGKGLGGSGQMNYMIHGENISEDLKKWKSFGINGWEYEKILFYIERIFRNENKPTVLIDTKCKKDTEMCSVEKNESKSSYTLLETKTDLADIFSQAINELKSTGLKYIKTESTIHQGQRWTSYHSHLKPVIGRKNLHVLLNTRVTKVIFNNRQAVGVETLSENGKKEIVYSKRDIILSAGAFQTPQILILSGIGPGHILRRFNIPVVAELSGVGRNLHDQITMPLFVSIEKPISFTIDKALTFSEIWNYTVHRKGLFGSSAVAGMVKGPKNSGIILFGMGSTDEKLLRGITDATFETFISIFPFYNNSSKEGFVMLNTCLKPTSRGYVSLQSSNPRKLPIVNPQYLSKYHDIECMIKAIKVAKEILSTTVLKNIGVKAHWPKMQNCQKLSEDSNSDQYLECIIRTGMMTSHHPGGTCRMGSFDDKQTVVDNFLRVKGVLGVRIFDASILPEPLSTFPNSVLMAMAEHASDLIISNL